MAAHPELWSDDEDLNDAALNRLRWPILHPAGIAGIEVVNNLSTDSPNVTPYTVDHPIASQYMTKSFATKIIFFVQALAEYESEWHDVNDFIDPHPEPMRLEDCWDALIVYRDDGAPLTVGDVVSQLHKHFHRPPIKDRIREALAWMRNQGLGHINKDGKRVVEFEGRDEEFVPEDVNIWIQSIHDDGIVEDEGCHQMGIRLWVEGEFGVDAEHFWKYGPR